MCINSAGVCPKNKHINELWTQAKTLTHSFVLSFFLADGLNSVSLYQNSCPAPDWLFSSSPDPKNHPVGIIEVKATF